MNEQLRQMPGATEAFLGAIPLNRVGTTDDVASAALYLASDDASFVSGVNFVVNGAWATAGFPDLSGVLAGSSPEA